MKYDLTIVGGLGPLASNVFLDTIYRASLKQSIIEQSMPNILLYSLPQIPDRTESFLLNKQKQLMLLIEKLLSKINALHTKKIIFCCFTIYGYISQLSSREQNNIISLPDLLLHEIIQKKEKTLVLCTHGTRHLLIFENSFYWNKARDFVIFCDEEDQKYIHGLIYELKAGKLNQHYFKYINQLVEKYPVSYWAVGCTELHLLTSLSHFGTVNMPLFPFIDPLLKFALAFNL